MPLIVPGLVQGAASTPDHASLAVADLDVRIRLSMEFWGPVFLSTHLVGQGDQLGGNNAWVYSIHPNQRPRLAIYPDSQVLAGPEATAAITYAGGITEHWLRATCDFNNGSGNSVFNYYTSEDGSVWNQLGAANLTDAVVVMHDSTDPLAIPASGLGFFGRVYYAEVRSGIGGTIVANPDFAAQAPGTTSFVDSTGKTWTIGNGGSIDTGINAQQIQAAGSGPQLAGAAAGGDRFQSDDRVALLCRNTNALTRRVVVSVPGIHYGQPRPDVEVTIPATSGERLIGPLPVGLINPTSGKIDVSYPDGVAGVTVTAVRV